MHLYIENEIDTWETILHQVFEIDQVDYILLQVNEKLLQLIGFAQSKLVPFHFQRIQCISLQFPINVFPSSL